MQTWAILNKLAAAVAAVMVVSCCSTTRDYSAPASFTISDDAVTNVVQQALARTSFATPEDGPPTVDCQGRTRCAIAYTVQQPVGWINDVELLLPTRQVWKAMFTDPQFQKGAITVSGPAQTPRGKQLAVFFTVSCDRGAVLQIDWNKVDADGLKTLCNYTQQIRLPFVGLNGPTGVAVDTGGNVYVADGRNNKRVLRLSAETPSTEPFFTHTNPVELPLNVQVPSSVAVMGGDIYFTDNGRVLKLAASSRAPVELPFAVRAPTGVAVDTAGDVYTADGESGRLFKLPAWSTTQAELPFESHLKGLPGSLAVDDVGNVFLARKDNVWKLSAGTNTWARLPFRDLKSSNGVAVDTGGNIYVTDGLGTEHDRVLVLPAESGAQVELPFTCLNRPTGVAADAMGNVYVTDAGNNRVLELPATTVSAAIADFSANKPPRILSPCGAFDA